MERLNVGLVGYGFAGRTFHAPLIAATPGLRLAAIATSNPEQARADWPEASTMPTPEALLARGDIDLVVIATPNHTHAPLARVRNNITRQYLERHTRPSIVYLTYPS